MRTKSNQNKIFMKKNCWSKVGSRTATSQSGRNLAGFFAGFKAVADFIFFFKMARQSGQVSGQKLAGFPAGFGPCVLSKFFVSFPSLKAVLLRSSNKDIYKMKTLRHTGRHNLPSLNECRPRHSTCTNQVKNPLDGTQASKQALRIKQHLLV